MDAVKGVSLYVEPGEILAIVGESGSGKTVTARTILGLLPETATASGVVMVHGTDVTKLSPTQLRAIRGREASMVFQEPSSALNPVFPIWWQIGEGLRAHDPSLTKAQVKAKAKAKAVEALKLVGIPDAENRINRFPHEFSGGQKQRIIIAMALSLGAGIIIADEPTTALDVSVQATVLELFRNLQAQFRFASLFISHDLAVVDSLADRVGVLYRGRLVEVGPSYQIMTDPQDAYTRRLIASLPVPDPVEQAERRRVLLAQLDR